VYGPQHNRVRRFTCPHESCAYKGAHPGDLSSHIKRCRHIRAAAFAHTDELASGSVAASEGTPDIELLPPPEPQLPLHPAVAAMLSEMTAAAESLLPPPEPQLQPSAPATDSIAASDIELLPPPEPQLQPSAQAVAAMKKLSEMTAAAESLARPALIAVAPQPAETVARTSAML
jgi:hypothetical protein